MLAAAAISDEMIEKLVAFVDREDGRDAPLSVEDEAMIRRMITHDPAASAFVDELRATNAELGSLLDSVADVEVPPHLASMIRCHGSGDVAIAAIPQTRDHAPKTKADDGGSGEEADIVSFRQLAAQPRRTYGPVAAAATIACLISTAALFQLYTTSAADQDLLQSSLTHAKEVADNQAKQLSDARSELKRLSAIANLASIQSQKTVGELITNEDAIQRLEVERAVLEGRYAALEGRYGQLRNLLEGQRAAIGESKATRDKLAAELSNARQTLAAATSDAENLQRTLRAEVDALEAEIEKREQDIAVLSEDLSERDLRVATMTTSLAALRDEQTTLQRQLTSVELDRDRLREERQVAGQAATDAEQRLASLEAEVANADEQIAPSAIRIDTAETRRLEAQQQTARLAADLAASTNWLTQVAQYHRVYASTTRRRLVEVEADEREHIQEWLAETLGREIIVPDLSNQGITFAGARLLGVNEKPVAQLVYLDANEQPLALCIIPMDEEAKKPTLSFNRDLNLVDWRDGNYGYTVVGWSDPDLLTSVTKAVQPLLDL